MMALINSLGATSVALLCLGYFLNPVLGSGCSLVTYGTTNCRDYDTITVVGHKITKNSTDVRVKLPGSQKETPWYCGPNLEPLRWGEDANQLRVNFPSNGEVHWSIYKCSNLDGPTKAGDNCAVAETIASCPGVPDGNHTDKCVYEVTTRYEGERQVTTTTQLSWNAGGKVQAQGQTVGGEASGGVSEEDSEKVTEVEKVEYQSKRYLVVPPGYSFCSFTNNTSKADPKTPTGFKWVCYLPRFVQIKGKFNNIPCTKIKICDKGVCSPADEKFQSIPTTGRSKGFSIHVSTFVLAVNLACAMLLRS